MRPRMRHCPAPLSGPVSVALSGALSGPVPVALPGPLPGPLPGLLRAALPALSLVLALAAAPLAASDNGDIAQHKSSVAAALSELGVSEFEALRCMAKMPDHVWLGSKLTKEQGAADKAAMLSCLRQKNPALTEAQLDAAVGLFK